jgi:NitT/TauT family transport system substrate-binding protein
MKSIFTLAALIFLVLAAPARAQDKIVFAFGSDSLIFLPWYVAEAKGYFAAHGIKPELVVLKGGPLAMTATLAGDADILGSGVELNIATHEKGRKIVAFAALVTQLMQQIVAQEEVSKRTGVTSSSPAAERLKALKGLKIGITGPGSSTDRFTRYLVSLGGYNPDRDVEIIPLGESGPILAAFQQKRIDAFFFSSPTPERAILEMKGFTLVNLAKGEFEPLRDFLFNVLSATPEWLAKNGDKAVRVTRAVAQGLADIHEKPLEAKAAAQKYFPKLEPRILDAAFEQALPGYPKTLRIARRGLEVNYAFIKASEGRDVTIPIEALYTTEIFDKAMAK